MFILLFVLGCNGIKNQNIIGIDVSGSFKSKISKKQIDIQNTLLNLNGEKLVFFIFADKSYEIFSGERPQKDRELLKLADQSIITSNDIKWQSGTDFLGLLTFVEKKILNSKESSSLFLISDGFFEKTTNKESVIKNKISNLESSGLKTVTFIGVNIINKEKIYNWFEDSGIKVIFN